MTVVVVVDNEVGTDIFFLHHPYLTNDTTPLSCLKTTVSFPIARLNATTPSSLIY